MLRARLHEQEIRSAIGVPGDGDLVIEGIAPLGAPAPRALHWYTKAVPPEEAATLSALPGCLVLAPPGTEIPGCRVLAVPSPRLAVARVLGAIRDLGRQPPLVSEREIAPTARISPHAVIEGAVRIGDDAEIGPFCTVGPDVVLERGVVLAAGVRVRGRVVIGEDTRIGENTVIGEEGYQHVRDEQGDVVPFPNLGGIVIGARVRMGSLNVVETNSLEPTVIEDEARIGALNGIGHGARVGRRAGIVGGVLLAGHTEVADDAWIGLNVSVREGRRVGARALAGMDASLQEDLPDDRVARAPRPAVAPRPDRGGLGFSRG